MTATVNENCISCGLCAGTCPEVFHMGEDGFAHGSEFGSEATGCSAAGPRWLSRQCHQY